MRRNEGKSRSVRKVLRDVSNHSVNNDGGVVGGEGRGRFSKSAIAKNIKSASENQIHNDLPIHNVRVPGGGGGDDDCLDRLLLVQSDLASLTRQVDELLAEAFKLKPISTEGKNEVESFTHFLSNMLSSLKPWVPRFQKAFSPGLSTEETRNQFGQCSADKSVSLANDDENLDVQSPEHTKFHSLISPSPLVSWRLPDCNADRGRQLFLLTPLPMSKTVSLNPQDLSKSVFDKIALSSALEVPSILAIPSDVNDVLQQTPSKPSSSVVTGAKTNFDGGFVSSPVFPKGDRSILVMTPCLKMSPPKSCVLLEPISESMHKGNYRLRKSTPFPVGISSHISESSSNESSEDLAQKYPELLGLQRAYKSRMGKKDLEASPNWPFSPPKTCILLEPPDEKSQGIVPSTHYLPIGAPHLNQQTNLTLPKQNDVQGGCVQIKKSYNQEHVDRSITLVETTPMWKEPESTIRTGKLPGENTLKKELWTKFEAASTRGFQLNSSAFRGNVQKGFLDMLDEVSCDGESPVADGLR